MTTITFINQKGGVGKTTLSILAAEALAVAQRPTLLVDMDPLATCSDLMLVRYDRWPALTVTDWLSGACGEAPFPPMLSTWLDIIPADNRLEDVLTEMSANPARVFDLRTALGELASKRKHDFVIIDAPPSLSALAWASIIAADVVIVPTLADPTSIKGLTNVMKQIEDIRFQVGLAPTLIGVVVNMVDERITTDRQALALLEAEGMPRVLGKLPRRRGRDGWRQLRQAFVPIAQEIVCSCRV